MNWFLFYVREVLDFQQMCDKRHCTLALYMSDRRDDLM